MSKVKTFKAFSGRYHVYLYGYTFTLEKLTGRWALSNNSGVEVITDQTKASILRMLEDSGVHHIDRLHKQTECTYA